LLSTANGVDVSPGASVSIQLADTSGVTGWFLQIIGTDELSSAPILAGVNTLTNQVTSPGTVVTLTFPAAAGSALGFRSEVQGTGGPIATTFGVYSLTTFATRVGFVTETREGDTDFGWATKLNPLIRSGGGGGGGGGGGYTLTEVTDVQTIPAGQVMNFEANVVLEDGGAIDLVGDVLATRTEDNFSILYIAPRSERVVQENDEMLFTDDMVVDGQLTVDGQLVDVTPYDGNDVLMLLTTVIPNAPAILSQNITDISLVTTTATPAVAVTYTTTTNNSIVSFEFLVIARSASNETAAFKFVALAQRLVGATSVVIEDLAFLNGPYRSAGAAAWDVSVLASGGGPDIHILVTGALDTISWRAFGTILERS
jgi:hypothetical protein